MLKKRRPAGIEDPLGTQWLQWFIRYLNATPKQAYRLYLQRLRKIFGDAIGAGSWSPPSFDALSQDQERLRKLVGLYLKENNRDEVEQKLRLALSSRPYVIDATLLGKRRTSRQERETLAALYNLPPRNAGTPHPHEKGAVANLRYLPYQDSDTIYPDAHLMFVLLLGSSWAERLKKCPGCQDFFLARKRKDQRCCSERCSHRVADRNERERFPEAYRKRKAEEAKRRRQLKKQQTK